MKKKIEIAVHITLQLLVIALLVGLLSSWRTAQAQFCADNLNPCNGASCNVHISTCENQPCPVGWCSPGHHCCKVNWGVCTEFFVGCQFRDCCDMTKNLICVDGICDWILAPQTSK